MLTFFWYPDGSDDPWKSWYERQDSKVRARHDVVMRALGAGHWHMDYFRTLTDRNGLGEIRITSGVAHRLVGRLQRNPNIFTVTIACSHKDDRYKPQEALNTAETRIKEIDQGKTKPVACRQPQPAAADRSNRSRRGR